MISPDDVQDTTDIALQLREWIWSKKDLADPGKMAFILLVVGAEIAEAHILDKDKIGILIDSAVKLGRKWGKECQE